MKNRDVKQRIILGALSLCLFFVSQNSLAGVIELSGTAYYSQSNYGGSNFTWTRRWGLSVGYYFLALSEIEFSVQDIFYRTKLGNSEDTSFHDQVYSIDWVQTLAPKNAILQPYAKLGIGQLNREASGSSSEHAVPIIYDAITAVVGAGFKFYVFKTLALKMEGSSYLLGGLLSTAKDNFSLSGGISIYF